MNKYEYALKIIKIAIQNTPTMTIFCQYTRAERRGLGAEAPKPRRIKSSERLPDASLKVFLASSESVRFHSACGSRSAGLRKAFESLPKAILRY